MTTQISDTSERELILTRLFNVPRELVWEVWTNPEHIINWWGPTGFTNTIFTMDVKAGGEWNLTIHAPDGIDYKNKAVFTKIIKPERIVYEHVSAPEFVATITFEQQDNKTMLTWHMLFQPKEQFEKVVKTFKADEGFKQTIAKLEIYLAGQLQ